MKVVMSWIKDILINIAVFIVFVGFIEVGSGFSRIYLGKEYLPYFSHFLPDENDPSHPCIEMKTDVLLDHIPNHRNLCEVKGGEVNGEYVVYNFSQPHLPKVLTLGGSTTSGFYQHISNGETYPKILAEMVSSSHFLINGGVGGYSSLQEFYKFNRDGTRIDDLEIVISLNGINDIPGYHGLEDIREFEYPFLTGTQHRMNQDQTWIEQRIDDSFLTKVLKNVLPNVNSLLVYLNKKRLTADLASKNESKFLKSVNAAQRWETNVKRLNALAALENIQYFVFLQPTMGLSGSQSAPTPGTNDALLYGNMDKNYIATLNDFYNQVKVICEKLEFCIDISNEVPPLGQFYNDPRHHNEKGNKVLAELIYAKVFEQN